MGAPSATPTLTSLPWRRLVEWGRSMFRAGRAGRVGWRSVDGGRRADFTSVFTPQPPRQTERQPRPSVARIRAHWTHPQLCRCFALSINHPFHEENQTSVMKLPRREILCSVMLPFLTYLWFIVGPEIRFPGCMALNRCQDFGHFSGWLISTCKNNINSGRDAFC